MTDFVVGLGLVFVLEGLLWALAPRLGLWLLEAASGSPEHVLRFSGLTAVALGAAIVWFVRG